MLLPLLALAMTSPLDLTQPNRYYVNQAPPLQPSPFQKLPVGAVLPDGWLRKQLELQADGFSGRLEEISEFLKPETNAWLHPATGTEHGWEEVPYWLRGDISLGYLLHSDRIEGETKKWIEGILASRKPNGWFGPVSNLNYQDGKPDLWPNMLALYALRTYYEHTSDPRVIELMSAYFKWENSLPDDQLLYPKTYWQFERGADNLDSVIWLYDRTKDPFLLDLAKRLHRHTANWTTGVPDRHGVNFAQAFRGPATYYLVTRDPADLAATERDYLSFRDEFGQVPGGMYGADENARPGYTGARQGTETCAMVEMMLSHEDLMTMTGDPTWADRCEDVAFNSLPAATTADEKALRYLTCPNMVLSDRKSKDPEIQNSGPMFAMDPNDHRCCQHNVSMGWPYFVEHMWLATNNDGLAAMLYGPCSVTAKVGDGAPATIAETTDYPFRDRIRFKVSSRTQNRFPLTLRVPWWCESPQLYLNGHQISAKREGGYLVLDRTWSDGDQVGLRLPMTVRVHTWKAQKDAVSVSRGPLSYSLRIGEQYVRSGGTDAWPAYEIHPTTAWNFGLTEHPYFTVIERPMPADDEPFSADNSPVEIVTLGKQIPNWRIDALGLVGSLQQSPAHSNERMQPVHLIPMGAARLRISVFPTVTAEGGTDWHS